jgi:Cof subfamily protein (haloacid dehalogenase superfamily)
VNNVSGIKLVATDIDGTLVNDHGELAPFTISVLRNLLEQDVHVVLVTGLNPWPTKHYVQQIGHGIRAICLNGVFFIENGHLQPGSFVDGQVALDAVRFILKHGYVPLVYGTDNVSRYIPGNPEAMKKVTSLIRDRAFQPYVPVKTLEDLFKVRPVQVSICDSDNRATDIYPELQNAVGDRAYVVYQPGGRSGRSWVEVNNPEARKDISLLALAERLGISSDEIVYFGDNLNDIPVFTSIAYSVAVANARSEVLDLSWCIAKSNNEHGVARFLVDFFNLYPLGRFKTDV